MCYMQKCTYKWQMGFSLWASQHNPGTHSGRVQARGALYGLLSVWALWF